MIGMSRRILLIVLSILASHCVFGQVPGILGLPDRIMSSSRIGRVSSRNTPTVIAVDTATVVFPSFGTKSVSQDYDFFKYLSDNDLKQDAKTLLQGAYAQSDTLDFLRAKVLFADNKFYQASSLFSRVPSSSSFGPEAFYYRIVALSSLGEYDLASGLLNSPSLPKLFSAGGPYAELSSLQAAGLALLKGEKDEWARRSASFTFDDYALLESEKVLSDISINRFESRGKRAGIAALASTFIPGAGKVYAGRLGEGVAAFMTVGSLGAITAENWKKHGLKDWRTILAGSLCATFYLGNIYGSYMSVSIEKDKRIANENATIIYHLHLPLRTVFR